MAIDSAAKRRNVAFHRGGGRLPGVTPSASPDAAWRAQAARIYGGIGASEPTTPGGIAPLIIRNRRRRGRR